MPEPVSADTMREHLISARAIAWKLYKEAPEGTPEKNERHNNWLRVSAAVWGA